MGRRQKASGGQGRWEEIGWRFSVLIQGAPDSSAEDSALKHLAPVAPHNLESIRLWNRGVAFRRVQMDVVRAANCTQSVGGDRRFEAGVGDSAVSRVPCFTSPRSEATLLSEKRHLGKRQREVQRPYSSPRDRATVGWRKTAHNLLLRSTGAFGARSDGFSSTGGSC